VLFNKLFKSPFDTIKFLDETTHRKCPVCKNIENNQSNFATFVENRHLYSVKICNECGFVFQNPIYNKEHYHSLPCSYPTGYWSHSYRRAKYILDFCCEYLKDNISILDIGAGKGGVLMNLHIQMRKNVKYSVGITLEDDKALFSDDLLFKFDFEDDIEVDEFVYRNENKFDFIIMSHVLEHFIDPDKAIKNVIKLLAPDGIVYIEVPDLYTAEYKSKSVWTPEHLSYFTISSLTQLMMDNRFWPEKTADSKIWGNIKGVFKYVGLTADIDLWKLTKSSDVKNIYNKDKFKKWLQRMKHKLGYKYEANNGMH
jgi:SAM-dependent methyltransferase